MFNVYERIEKLKQETHDMRKEIKDLKGKLLFYLLNLEIINVLFSP